MTLKRLSNMTIVDITKISCLTIEKRQGVKGPAYLSSKLVVDGAVISISDHETKKLLEILETAEAIRE